MTDPRRKEIFSLALSKADTGFLDTMLAGGLAYLLSDHFGEAWFHFSGLVAGAAFGVAKYSQLCEREAGLDNLLGRIDAAEQDGALMKGVDGISQGYIDNSAKELGILGDELEELGKDDSSDDSCFEHVLKFVIPPFGYVSAAVYFISGRAIISNGIRMEKDAYEKKLAESLRYLDWAKERNEKLGGRDV